MSVLEDRRSGRRETEGVDMESVRIAAIASYIPSRVVTNDDMAELVDTSDEWITGRTGIHRRHFAAEGESNTDEAIAAGRAVLAKAQLETDDIMAVIVCTFTPDRFTASTASHVREALGLGEHCLCFDLNGACAGYIYGLRVARGLLLQEDADAKVLLICSELISSVLDFTDRSTCVLFGDGAAASIVELAHGRRDHYLVGSRDGCDLIDCPTHHHPRKVPGIRMDGREVFRFACGAMEETIEALLAKTGLRIEDIDHVVCHQANARIINHVIRHMDADPGIFYLNVADYGNTSAASIPIALAEMDGKGLLQRGEKVMLVAFGAGLVYGGALLEW